MPHSDDEWIGCCQLLKQYSAMITVIDMDMQGGDSSSLHIKRKYEAISVGKKYGYRFITIEKDKIAHLTELLEKNVPDCVMLPSFYDWHQEHFDTMDIFRKAASRAKYKGDVAMYQVSLPIPPRRINCGFAMSKSEWREKWKLFKKLYASQRFLPTKRFMLNEFVNGKICGAYAMEVYSVMGFQEWEMEYKCDYLSSTDKKFCKEHLNEIKTIRNYLDTK